MSRLLLALSQMPQDPSSGAARSLRTIGRLLAGQGFEVRALGVTATERRLPSGAMAHLEAAGLRPRFARAAAAGLAGEIRFDDGGVACALLHTAEMGVADWPQAFGRQFDALFDEHLRDFRPDALLTFGGSAVEIDRRRRARAAGAAVVFGLRNWGYLHPGAFPHVDAILAASRHLADRYRLAVGIEATPLPLPLDFDEVVAPEREPVFATFINPSRAKGVMLFARLAEELGRRRPDIPLLVVESRGGAEGVVAAGAAGGFDLRRHGSIMFSPGSPHPRGIFGVTRVLLAPSVWEEPAGRVAAEALVNGVPPVVSDRGGLAEVCHGGGFVLPLPADLRPDSSQPAPAGAVEPWLDLIVRLADDAVFYEDASRRAREAGAIYAPGALGPRYADYFREVIGRGRR